MQGEMGEGSVIVSQLLAERLLPPTLAFPQNCTQRIKYSCFDVSNLYLMFGTTTGGLFVFHRETCEFLQLIPNKKEGITRIKISPDEKCVALSTYKGTVNIYDCGVNTRAYTEPSVLQSSNQHQGNEVTYFVWSENGKELYISDDTGTISVLHMTKFMAKNMFQMTTFALMHLDSRVVQLDIKDHLLLVSTLSRCFICDTMKETYAQIGHKLRDGEFGACFYDSSLITIGNNGTMSSLVEDRGIDKIIKAFNVVSIEEHKCNLEKLANLKMFCARPGSRLWEVETDGSVVCTHQFKNLLAIPPSNIISASDYEEDDLGRTDEITKIYEDQLLNFSKLMIFKNRYVLCYTKEGIYIFDPKPEKSSFVVLWTDKYKDIIECKVLNDLIYIWKTDGNLSLLSFQTIENYLVHCYVNKKYKLCGKICAYYASSLMKTIDDSSKLHTITDLGRILVDMNEIRLQEEILPILDSIAKIKPPNVQKQKSGIVVVDNSYMAKMALDENCTKNSHKDFNISNSEAEETSSTLFQKHPDAVKVFKDIGDKLSMGTQKLMQKLTDLEGKVKKIGSDKNYNEPLDVGTPDSSSSSSTEAVINNDVESFGHKNNTDINIETKISDEKINNEVNLSPKARSVYLFIIQNEDNFNSNELIYNILTDGICDINTIYHIINEVENYMISLGNSQQYSNIKCGKHFLYYINKISDLDGTIDFIISDDSICSYFLKSLIGVNSISNCVTSCDCGYPLPTAYSSQTPEFSEMLDVFIEKLWKTSQSDYCYNICKNVPYMWRKMLILRKNEDLIHLLLVVLQMLDEELLYSYLPQFTVDTWKVAIKLFGTLRKQECLNCGEKFKFPTDNDIRYKSILDWDTIGFMMLKTIGCNNTTKILKMYSELIPKGGLSVKFYHSNIFLKLFEKFNGTISSKLLNTIYESYEYEEVIPEMSEHLRNCLENGLPHTALPLTVASKTKEWGLKIDDYETSSADSSLEMNDLSNYPILSLDLYRSVRETPPRYTVEMNLEQTLEHLNDICPNRDCYHCLLPLRSRTLIVQGGLWVFHCGHTFHGVCLTVLKIKLCPICIQVLY